MDAPFQPVTHVIAVVLLLAGPARAIDQEYRAYLEGLFAERLHDAVEEEARRKLSELEAACGPDAPELAPFLEALVDALVVQPADPSREAMRLAERAVQLREREQPPSPEGIAGALIRYARLREGAGEPEAARRLLERAVGLVDDGEVAVRALRQLGVVLAHLGEYEGAEAVLHRAIRQNDQLGSLGPFATRGALHQSLGVLYGDMGAYAAARRELELALALTEGGVGPGHPDASGARMNLAMLLARTGDYGVARRLYEQCIARVESRFGSAHRLVTMARYNLASLLQVQGELAEAKRLLERSLEAQEQLLEPVPGDLGQTRNALGRVYAALGEPERARAMHERARLSFEQSGLAYDLGVADSLDGMATAHAALGKWSAARSARVEALRIRRAGSAPDHPLTAATLAELAVLELRAGDHARALEHALAAESAGVRHLRTVTRGLPERSALGYAAARPSGLETAIAAAIALGSEASRRQAWEAQMRSRALVLDEIAARRGAARADPDPERERRRHQLQVAERRLSQLALGRVASNGTGDRGALLARAQHEVERAEILLAPAGRRPGDRRVDLEQVKRALPPGTALVAYARSRRLAGDDAAAATPRFDYVAFILPASATSPALIRLGDEREVDAAVERWRRAAAQPPSPIRIIARRDEAAYRVEAEPLRRMVWDPVAPLVADAAAVFIVPTGALHLVSFGVLPEAEGRYLADREVRLHYLSAERDLLSEPPAPRGSGLLVVGAPDFDLGAARGHTRGDGARGAVSGPSSDGSWPPLPGADAEAREVHALWRDRGAGGPRADDVLTLTGARATEEGFARLAPGREYIHVATHAFLAVESCEATRQEVPRPTIDVVGLAPPPPLCEQPLLLSGLVLAGANRGSGEGSAGDGLLTAYELSSIDLSDTRWVVLSACQTGVGKVLNGEGVLGLRRSLRVAGARSLVFSLWRVADQGAGDWMRGLYRERFAGRSTIEAVHRATRAVLASRRQAGLDTHPFSWGAFVAEGDWR